jgi:mono/diheme cytochrome c family protein
LARILLLLVPLLLGVASYGVPAAEPDRAPAASPGLALAQASCGSCHAVERHGRSPYSSAPPFPVIVNQEGLTEQTLSYWLKGAHNYPSEMDFILKEREVDALVRYMLTLRVPNFKRPQD